MLNSKKKKDSVCCVQKEYGAGWKKSRNDQPHAHSLHTNLWCGCGERLRAAAAIKPKPDVRVRAYTAYTITQSVHAYRVCVCVWMAACRMRRA